MKIADTGGHAFPHERGDHHGMSFRNHLAAQAMKEMIRRAPHSCEADKYAKCYAHDAYAYADAMIAESNELV